MPELLWIDDIPMPNMAEEDYNEDNQVVTVVEPIQQVDTPSR